MTGKLLTRLFALFGMTLTCVACYGIEYTEYNPEFGASGRVVDQQNNPIEGSSGGNVTYTDANGHFRIYSTSPMLTLTDVDGEANGGEFVQKKITYGSNSTDIELGDITLESK